MSSKIPAFLFTIFIAWVITQANLGSKSTLIAFAGSLPYGDKIGHLVLFGILSALMIVAFQFKTLSYKKLKVPIGAIIVFSFAMLEEFSQLFFVNRNFDLLDLFADAFGIYLSVLITNWITTKSTNRQKLK